MRGRIKYVALVLAVLVGSLLSWRVRADNPHGPTVVASGGGANLTSSIALTNLWTPTADGFFTIKAYVANHSGTGCTDSDQLHWTDTLGTNHNYTGFAGQGPAGSITIYATTANPIQFSVTQSGTCNYDYFIIVIKE